MKQYLELLNHVLTNGALKHNRTGIDTISLFGVQTRYDLQKGFPLLTTKKVNFNAVIHELLWFIKGDTNIKYLVDNDVKIWNEWPFKNFKSSPCYHNETMQDFIDKIKSDDLFAEQFGNLGPVYGKQWRDFNGFDQLKNLIMQIEKNPNSRRLIISAWNPNDIPKMLLPPCHCFFQFYINNNQLSCQLYQRSADLFLGVPFNISSYSLLIHMLADSCNLNVGEFIHTIGDCHIYVNHIEQVKIQLSRKPKPLPKIKLNKHHSLFDYIFNDIQIEDYDPDPFIKAEVAV